jgi:limonene-1,2-epoxide hydrolase
LLDYFTEDGIWHPMPWKPTVGKTALFETISQWLAATTQLGAETQLQVSAGRRVMHERTDRFSFGTQEMVTPVGVVFGIEDGLMTAWREYFDMSPLARRWALRPETLCA